MNTEEEEAEGALQRLESLAMNIGGRPDSAFTILRGLVEFSRIQMSISRSADKQARKVIALTWVIAALTVVLLLFTAYLSYDAYQKDNPNEKKITPAAQQNNSPPPIRDSKT